eukprot:TRINITY_DN6320_c0_g1_i1.p2 TRINITY_DN6320_c0_g1~~TRINITY_DN6320_c0_g1_i1.p2  ORF type:complete len:280 (-),score=87.76 TRINITY_DN6320_c0_g1_i1:987-1826(-)
MEDEVEREIDVYLSQTLAENLCLFQYPLRQPWRPYPLERLQEIKIKPLHQRMEMSFELDKEGENFDSDNSNAPPSLLLSSSVIPHKTNYAIGVFRGDELHLTPLTTIYQFRPTFPYIDKAEEERKKLIKEEEAPDEDSNIAPEDDEFAGGGPRTIQVQFKRKETPRMMAGGRLTHAMMMKMEDDESWSALSFHDSHTEETEKVFDSLFAQEKVDIPQSFIREAYLPFLCPAPVVETGITPQLHEGINMTKLKTMPLLGQLRSILSVDFFLGLRPYFVII